MDEFNPPSRVDDEEDRAACEDIAIRFKRECPEEVVHFRRFMEEGCGPLTDKEFDRLLILYAEHAWLGIEPGEE